ncbi:hypothetical protein P7D43_05240 [Enterococcus avium]|uniref:Uncharacterized protein n=1 Tax=Enterococcus avium TaxID=33945 RepID=A0AAW8RQX0_ENTAV|nr:hypothetical protein [Enterococcus avium]MDT2401770.1 hypothetical protein [Enterococcus avium]MDT2434212.1 hypothetical protein [Enterococcus avium]MDT2466110.1 hypothetical protein [Enterococcus avium]MDT2484057.1 hypothetical protein [Enterococcus avium]MDT2505536.1 hypothetical protein [Enterococcus avium]
MEPINYQLAFSEAAATYVSDVNHSFEKEVNEPLQQQIKENPEEVLTRSDVEKMLEAHLSKIETLIQTSEQKIDQMDKNTPQAEVIEKTEGFLTKIKEALKDFSDTVKYLVGDMTDDARLKVKNGINSRILRVNSSIKSLGEKIDKKFAIEAKVVRIDPREEKRDALAAAQKTQAKPEVAAQSGTAVDIDVSKAAEVTFNPPKTDQTATLSEKEVHSLLTDKVYDFKKVSEFAFNKRAEATDKNWEAYQEKFGDSDLSQAWNVFLKDAWNIQSEIAPMINSELASTWEQEYYDFFYVGGKEAYDSSIEKGTHLDYSPEAIQHFESLYDQQVAKTMQENLSNEVIGKHSPARGEAPIVEQSANEPLPHEMESKQPVQKPLANKPNKFEQRKAAAIEKNKMIEQNLAASPDKQVVNDSPTMK